MKCEICLKKINDETKAEYFEKLKKPFIWFSLEWEPPAKGDFYLCETCSDEFGTVVEVG